MAEQQRSARYRPGYVLLPNRNANSIGLRISARSFESELRRNSVHLNNLGSGKMSWSREIL